MQESIARGANAEIRFKGMCNDRMLYVSKSTSYEDRIKHFDYHVRLLNGDNKRVEVKSMKSRRRGDKPDPTVIFVELNNIVGCHGWVYGASDIVAFEQPDGFLMVDTVELRTFTEYMRGICARVEYSGVHHTLYGRWDRKDLVLVLCRADVMQFKNTFFLSCK
jgi:hypothetical protein